MFIVAILTHSLTIGGPPHEQVTHANSRCTLDSPAPHQRGLFTFKRKVHTASLTLSWSARPTAPPNQIPAAANRSGAGGNLLERPLLIPLSVTGDPAAFAVLVETHRAALAAQRAGKAGVPVPVASPLIESLVQCVHRGDPYPDDFVVVPYEIYDDTPVTPEQQQALAVLRETMT